MKELLLSPLVISLLFFIAIVYFFIAFQLVNTNNNLGRWVEKVCSMTLIMIIGGVQIGFMAKFHPKVLYLHNATLPTISIVVLTYLGIIFLLTPRIVSNTKNVLIDLVELFLKNPFIVIYYFLILISFSFSKFPIYTFKASLVFWGVTLFLIYVSKQYSWRELFNILIWYHALAVVLSLLFGNRSFGGQGIWTGVWSHKNHFGPIMALSALLLYLQSAHSRRWYKWLFIVLAVLAVFCVQKASSGMAKALLAILISLVGFLRFIKRLPPKTAFACMGIFIAVGICLVILITENAEYIIVEKLGKDMTLTGRTEMWPLILDAINKRPLFGYGFLGFWQDWRGIDSPSFNIVMPNGFRPGHAHNGFLDVGLDLGWVGLALLVCSLITNIYYGILHLINSKSPEDGLPLIIFTWLIIENVTETSLTSISGGWMFYILMTAKLAMDETKNNNHDKIQDTIPYAKRLK